MHVCVLGVQASDTGDDDNFDLELGYTTVNQADDQPVSYFDADQQQEQERRIPQLFSDHHHSKRYQQVKHLSVQLYVNCNDHEPSPVFYPVIKHTPAIYPAYRYLYFREINPPPPKAC